MDSRDHLFYWILLQRIPGVGLVRYQQLLNHFDSPQAVFEASSHYLKQAGLPSSVVAKISACKKDPNNPLLQQVEKDLQWLEVNRAQLLTCHCADYPPLLKEIADPPPLLYVLGDPAVLALPQLAMVGARSASAGGRRAAYEFAVELAKNGITVTSGMALGIDAACHEGALQAGGNTIAVLGTGIDLIYPLRHRQLSQSIAQQGAVISEFPLGTGPKRDHFPRRNRLISGLSMGVLVVEAAQQSGSLISARCALEQNREVFAIPGSIHNPLSRGCHALIRQGAKLVENVNDIYEEIGAMVQTYSAIAAAGNEQADGQLARSETLSPPLAADEQLVFECIGYELTPLELIIDSSGLAVADTSAVLVNLELRGLVESDGGGYQRVPQQLDEPCSA